MSKTPRTDEQILHHDNGNGHPSAFVFASFTRQLETELADKDKQLEQMREAFERINGAAWRIKLAQGNSACSCESLNAADIIAWSSEYSKAALSAAERGE